MSSRRDHLNQMAHRLYRSWSLSAGDSVLQRHKVANKKLKGFKKKSPGACRAGGRTPDATLTTHTQKGSNALPAHTLSLHALSA